VTGLPAGFPASAYPLGANPSFADLLRANDVPQPSGDATAMTFAHGTTVLALKYADGCIMAGDRRATEGYTIADERIDKVFPADESSAIAIAGAAGQATEMVRLFQTEIEHYEKVEGDRLSLEGKANRLGQMIRQNFPMAMQGLVVVPLFAGYDERRKEGRLFRYDVTGGRWEEADYHSTGSGSLHARGSLKEGLATRLGSRQGHPRGGGGSVRRLAGGCGDGWAEPPSRHLPQRQDHYRSRA